MNWIKEISKEIKSLDTSSKEIRKFGLVIAIALGVIGSFVYVKFGNFDVVGWLWGIGLWSSECRFLYHSGNRHRPELSEKP